MEKDIEILEEMKKSLWEYFEDFKIDKDTSSTMKKIYEIRKAQVQALENLIKGYRELEEQNEDLKNDVHHDGLAHKDLTLKATAIPKSKIKEKIEEVKMTSSQINGDYFMNNYKIEVLQELMEE